MISSLVRELKMVDKEARNPNWVPGARTVKVTMLTLILAMSTFALAGSQGAPAKNPYDKERLLRVVSLNALSTQEIVDAIQERGVDFETTLEVEAEFKKAGARPELIDALRGNYRRPSATTRPVEPKAKSTARVPPGPPLSKNEVVTLLQGGLPSARVEEFVEARGVAFLLTPEITREITSAGGNRSLLGAISEKATTGSSGTSTAKGSSRPAGAPAGPDYDDLTDQAISAMQANNGYQAIRLLQQAVALAPARPTAYQLLGFAELYGSHDILAAERSMRAAIERGGGASFRVYHDHDGFFKTFCQGTFFVSKSGVTYKADDGNHTFAAEDSRMKEVELNGFVGSEYGAFHLKVFQDADSHKTKTYNFAPATTKKAESGLIITLIKSYH
jgi:hypothetical protein